MEIESSLEKIIYKESWNDIVERIEEVSDPIHRMDMYNNIPERDVPKDVYKKIVSGRHTALKELKSDKEELKQMAYTDSLTGLYNRRFLDESLPKELALSRRTGNPVSMLFFDIDYFKNFNDINGHDAGDCVLREMGKIINETFRESDSCYRYGGEEFVVILPDTDRNDTYSAAEILRKNVENHPWEYKGKDLGKVTISLGANEYDSVSDKRSFIKKADLALYMAKENGRNQTMVY